MALGGERGLARPLTRSTRAGEPYVRPPEVESQLELLLGASANEQLTRAAETNKESPRYVRDECLVYLIRDAWVAGDSARYSTLTEQLLRRSARGIQHNLRTLGVAPGDEKDVYGEVISGMMSAILDDGGAGDFYQARFRRALRFLVLSVYDKYARRQKRARREDDLDTPLGGDDMKAEDGVTLEERLPEDAEVAARIEQRLLIREALAAIRDPRHREAFVLHYYDDWPIETKDPLDPSVSRHLGVTPRTVNNWLREAERDMTAWRSAKGN